MGRIADLFRRPRKVTEDVPTARMDRPAPASPVLVGNVQGMGAREGQDVVVEAPSGNIHYTVVKIEH